MLQKEEMTPDGPFITVWYVDDSSVVGQVRSIFTWNRGDIKEQVLSTSSGPKDYIKNDVWRVFDLWPRVNRVDLMRTRAGALFLLMRDSDNCWLDRAGKQVKLCSE
jgi:hypothetical protein